LPISAVTTGAVAGIQAGASLPRFWIRGQWIQSGGLHGGRTDQQSVPPWSTLKEADYKAERRAAEYLQ